jgi:DNA-directed RNA polymerase specialized sigma24 family protein
VTPEQQTDATRLLPLALRTAKRYGADEELQSIAQLALCQAIVRFSSEWGISLNTHVFRSVRHHISHYFRARRRRREHSVPSMDSFPAPDPAADPFALLAEDDRELAHLHFIEGVAVRDCARKLGVPWRQVAAQIRRVKQLLTST